jgi:hypothetical protein
MMADITLKYIVVARPMWETGQTGDETIPDATSIVEVTNNDNGTVTVWYLG